MSKYVLLDRYVTRMVKGNQNRGNDIISVRHSLTRTSLDCPTHILNAFHDQKFRQHKNEISNEILQLNNFLFILIFFFYICKQMLDNTLHYVCFLDYLDVKFLLFFLSKLFEFSITSYQKYYLFYLNFHVREKKPPKH